MKHQSQRGVALVVTLILLSIITFLAVAFLAMSQRDRAAVGVAISQTDAKLAADTALARAQNEILARMVSHGTNRLNYGIMVSRSYENTNGFNSALTGVNYTNVNFSYRTGGSYAPISNADYIQNLANLFYDPRVPVFVSTNTDPAKPLDFRFYLDFNRNGRFDPNGVLPVRNDLDQVVRVNNRDLYETFTGDPEWIGIREKPEAPHSRTNRFLSRFTYLVVPVGQTLDMNYIHNYVRGNTDSSSFPDSMNNGDAFARNQGVGSWEMNLGGFLADLSPNMYTNQAPLLTSPYQMDLLFNQNTVTTMGTPFADAFALLKYRYNNKASSLSSVQQIFGATGALPFTTDFIDSYVGNLPDSLNAPYSPVLDRDTNYLTRPWAGSTSPNRFQDVQELFDGKKSSPDFVQRLQKVSTHTNSFDRYTFYRLLTQLGTDSSPEFGGKVNINYKNVTHANHGQVYTTVSNHVPWDAQDFFTTAADRLIRGYNTNLLTLTNIQIWPTNQYTPQVHRLLQMAANIYDATTSSTNGKAAPYFPSVFRPRFVVRNNQLYIGGYEVMRTNNSQAELTAILNTFNNTNKYFHLAMPGNRLLLAAAANTNLTIFDIPVIIGARKGYPNFNEFSQKSLVQFTRKLEVVKDNSFKLIETNQQFLVTITNIYGVEAWNSYRSAYTNNYEVHTRLLSSVTLNRLAVSGGVTNRTRLMQTNLFVSNDRSGRLWPALPPRPPTTVDLSKTNLLVTLFTNLTVLPTVQITPNGYTNFLGFYPNSGFQAVDWELTITNFLAYWMVDTNSSRIVDYVTLAGMGGSVNLGEALNRPTTLNGNFSVALNDLWKSERVGSASAGPSTMTIGDKTQFDISRGFLTVPDSDWKDFVNSPTAQSQADTFNKFLLQSESETKKSGAPFQPSMTLIFTKNWQANDPLVHYTLADLTDPKRTNDVEFPVPPLKVGESLTKDLNIGLINTRYAPWGGNPFQTEVADDVGAFNPVFRDPGIRKSDDWDFPTNLLANVGYLGRVHRGTPWQTIYFKSEAAVPEVAKQDRANWINSWSGTLETYPTNDWRLVEMFTAVPNENASRGTLSVNQTNLAAWSAVMSGVLVLTNTISDADLDLDKQSAQLQFGLTNIQPAVLTPHLTYMVDGLAKARLKAPFGNFQNLGSILAAPELTLASPYLNLSATQQKYGINDAAYERIPQQILGLLRVGEPRFVIYSYGQSLKPAENSLVSSGPFVNLCTNYQVMGEVTTRTILRVEDVLNARGQVIKQIPITESFTILQSDF